MIAIFSYTYTIALFDMNEKMLWYGAAPSGLLIPIFALLAMSC
jgi:hypothetical protein